MNRLNICIDQGLSNRAHMMPDIIMSVRFFLPSEGGRSAAVSGEYYGCPLFIDGEGFDCRLLLRGVRLELGMLYEVGVKFLSRDLVLPKLTVGKEVLLWEGKNTGKGNIIKFFITDENSETH